MPHGSPSPVSPLDQVNGGPRSQGRSEGDPTPKVSSLTGPGDQASGPLERQRWPEEDFSSTADEGGGFYPVRLGETFDNGRFVIKRKLGWGGFSSVWLARDRKYVSKTNAPLQQTTDSS